MIVIIFAQHAPVKSTRPAVRFVRSTNTEACSYSRVYVHVPFFRTGAPFGAPSAHFVCGKKSAGTSESGAPGTHESKPQNHE